MNDAQPSTDSALPASPPRKRGLRRLLGWGYRTVRNTLALLMVGVLILFFTPATNRIYNWLDVSVAEPATADYIVCLGGGWGREVRAAQLWHRKIAPRVIVSNQPGAAEWMRTLLMQAGVPRDQVVLERTSETTSEHPGGVARLPGIDRRTTRLVLVTDHTHARRSLACFTKAGFTHVEVWSGTIAPRKPRSYRERCVWRISQWPMIVYECGAMAMYAWRGNI